MLRLASRLCNLPESLFPHDKQWVIVPRWKSFKDLRPLGHHSYVHPLGHGLGKWNSSILLVLTHSSGLTAEVGIHASKSYKLWQELKKSVWNACTLVQALPYSLNSFPLGRSQASASSCRLVPIWFPLISSLPPQPSQFSNNCLGIWGSLLSTWTMSGWIQNVDNCVNQAASAFNRP